MMRIYFDGTIETAGQCLAACNEGNRRVHIVLDRMLLPQQRLVFLSNLQDCCGSLVHRIDGRIRPRHTVGSPRHCTRFVADGVEAFFRIVAELNEDDQKEALEQLESCACRTCGKCDNCAKADSIADAYGMYNLIDYMLDLKGRV